MTRYILALLLLATSLPAQGIRVTAPASGGGPTTPGTTVVGQPVTWGDTAGGELLDSGSILLKGLGEIKYSDGTTGLLFDNTIKLICFSSTCPGTAYYNTPTHSLRTNQVFVNTRMYSSSDGGAELGLASSGWNGLYLTSATAPGTPTANGVIYALNADKLLRYKDDAGTVSVLNAGWVDVNETLTIGPAVGDWPDCTSGGADDKTAATAETDFSGLTGYSAGHRWVMVYGDHGIASATAYFRVKIPNTSITSASNEKVPMWSYSNAATPGVTAIAGKFVASYPIKSDGTANIYCSQSSTLAGGDTMTILAFY